MESRATHDNVAAKQHAERYVDSKLHLCLSPKGHVSFAYMDCELCVRLSPT